MTPRTKLTPWWRSKRSRPCRPRTWQDRHQIALQTQSISTSRTKCRQRAKSRMETFARSAIKSSRRSMPPLLSARVLANVSSISLVPEPRSGQSSSRPQQRIQKSKPLMMAQSQIRRGARRLRQLLPSRATFARCSWLPATSARGRVASRSSRS